MLFKPEILGKVRWKSKKLGCYGIFKSFEGSKLKKSHKFKSMLLNSIIRKKNVFFLEKYDALLLSYLFSSDSQVDNGY